MERVTIKARTLSGVLDDRVWKVNASLVWDFVVVSIVPITPIGNRLERAAEKRSHDLQVFSEKPKKQRVTVPMQYVRPGITVLHDTTKCFLLAVMGTRVKKHGMSFLECLVSSHPCVSFCDQAKITVDGIQRLCVIVQCDNIVGAQLFRDSITRSTSHESLTDLNVVVYCVYKDVYDSILETREFNSLDMTRQRVVDQGEEEGERSSGGRSSGGARGGATGDDSGARGGANDDGARGANDDGGGGANDDGGARGGASAPRTRSRTTNSR